MNTTTTPNRDARLAPLSGDDYCAINAKTRRKDPAVCPCCDAPTTRGWLDDCGSCYHCTTRFDRRVLPPPPRLDVRMVNRGGRLVLVAVDA